MEIDLAEHERLRAIDQCRSCLGGIWKDVSDADVQVSRLSGGMSNILYRCTLKRSSNRRRSHSHKKSINREPHDVLLRFYGPVHADSELEVFRKLADQQLGPNLYSEFEGGRLEEYLPSRTLRWEEMVDDKVSSVIAQKIASVHQLDLVRYLGKNPNWLISQYEEYNNFLCGMRKVLPTFENCSESTKQLALEIMKIDYDTEIEYLSEIFRKCDAPLVFSHNDLHQNNIILLDTFDDGSKRFDSANIVTSSDQYNNNYNNNNNNNNNYKNNNDDDDDNRNKDYNNGHDLTLSTPIDDNICHIDQTEESLEGSCESSLSDRIVLIDFEYCSYNFRTFDIANHINEWCFDYNVNEYPYFKCLSDEFPSQDRQRQFIGHYARHVMCLNESDKISAFESIYDINELKKQNNLNAFIEILYDEMQPFLMASNLMWALWAIKCGCTSEIKFGYWEMAKCRWEMYLMCKQRYETYKINSK